MRKVDPAKHKGKRLEILEAAGRRFARKGFQGTSIAEICAAANISPGHLYHYFASKEAIIAAMAKLRLATATEAFGQLLDVPDPIAAFLRQLDGASADVETGATPLWLEVLAEAGRNPAIAQILGDHSRAVRALLGDVLRKAQSNGTVDPSLDPDLAASMLLTIVNSAKALTINEPELDRENVRDMMKVLVTRFLIVG